MSATTEPAPLADAASGKQPRDRRGFWRILLAIVVVLPMPAKGFYYLLTPVAGDATFQESVTSFEAHRRILETLKWFDAVFVVTLIPATIAVAWVARRGAPRLTTAGAVIALTGFLVGIALLGGVMTPALITVQHDLDVTSMAALDDALHHEPLLGVASLLFIVGIVFGLGLLGGALKRSRSVPAWVGLAVMIGGATHPFIPTHIGQGIGLFVAAAGFAGVSVALLRMTNDEFDLPAASFAKTPDVARSDASAALN
jgi:Signal transduction histidine kinase, glucose-6-phosphate specific